MQVIELVGIIFALLIEISVDIILIQLQKATNRKKTAWPDFYKIDLEA